MDCQSNINNLLPPFCPIRISNGVDRYGFSSVLARKCGLRYVPRSFANWIHGWIWSVEPTATHLGVAKLPIDTSIIVRNECEQQVLALEGFTNIRIGGLPFAYIPQCHTARSDAALLAFPAHSAEAEGLTTDQQDYFDYLESIKSDFDGVYVSIYYLDLNTSIHKAALARGLRVLQGAKPDDANALIRVRSILDGFKYVTSNVMGSHMLYALYAGCNFSFVGPYYSYDESVFLTNGNPHGYSKEYIDNSLFLQSEDYVRGRFSRFFAQHPSMGCQDADFAVDSIGERFVLHPREIKDVLGWSVAGQLTGYAKGATRRIVRTLQ